MTKKRYKFTKKKRSLRGMVAIMLSVAAAAIFAAAVLNSFESRGNGSVYWGSAGVLSMLLAVSAFVFAVLAVKEEDTFKAIPYTGLVCSVIASAAWIGVYAVGFLL